MKTGSNGRPLWVDALLDRGLSAVEYRVWMLLWWYQGDNGSAWPSQEAIGADLGLTRDGVRKITMRLEEKGWLRITRPVHTAPGEYLKYHVMAPNHADGCRGVHADGGSRVSTKSRRRRSQNHADGCPQEHIHGTRPSSSPSATASEIAELLLSLILRRKPDFKKPTLTVWAAEIDRMIRLDHRNPGRIREVVQWCQADPFWQNNILSASSLRKQFDRLEMKMGTPQQQRVTTGPAPAPAQAPAPVVRGADGLTPRERALQGVQS